jgi:ketosteroid isomerase-like protein
MKSILQHSLAVGSLILVLVGPKSAFAQEWSAPQKEVWNAVEQHWQADLERDLDRAMAYFHDDYLGWWNRDPVPSDKPEIRKWLAHHYKTSKVLVQSIKPVAIKLHGDVALVHYHWQRLEQNAKGDEKLSRGRWTDILRKHEGKWLLIGDHGGLEYHETE